VRRHGARTAGGWGLPVSQRGVEVRPRSHQTRFRPYLPRATPSAARPLSFAASPTERIRPMAIDQFLCGLPVTGCAEPFSTKIGPCTGKNWTDLPRAPPKTPRQAAAPARPSATRPPKARTSRRCLHCDCRALGSCNYGSMPRCTGPILAAFRASGDHSRGRATCRDRLRAGQVHRLRPVHPDRHGCRRAVGADVRGPGIRTCA